MGDDMPKMVLVSPGVTSYTAMMLVLLAIAYALIPGLGWQRWLPLVVVAVLLVALGRASIADPTRKGTRLLAGTWRLLRVVLFLAGVVLVFVGDGGLYDFGGAAAVLMAFTATAFTRSY